jgi:hypothetical protein
VFDALFRGLPATLAARIVQSDTPSLSATTSITLSSDLMTQLLDQLTVNYLVQLCEPTTTVISFTVFISY